MSLCHLGCPELPCLVGSIWLHPSFLPWSLEIQRASVAPASTNTWLWPSWGQPTSPKPFGTMDVRDGGFPCLICGLPAVDYPLLAVSKDGTPGTRSVWSCEAPHEPAGSFFSDTRWYFCSDKCPYVTFHQNSEIIGRICNLIFFGPLIKEMYSRLKYDIHTVILKIQKTT